jgi:translation initiation factor IF-1
MKEKLMEDTKRQRMEFEGVVIESNKGKFKVQINENYVVLCSLSGKIRINSVRILLGDTVMVEVSEYNVQMGRITYRLKGA